METDAGSGEAPGLRNLVSGGTGRSWGSCGRFLGLRAGAVGEYAWVWRGGNPRAYEVMDNWCFFAGASRLQLALSLQVLARGSLLDPGGDSRYPGTSPGHHQTSREIKREFPPLISLPLV